MLHNTRMESVEWSYRIELLKLTVYSLEGWPQLCQSWWSLVTPLPDFILKAVGETGDKLCHFR